MSLLFLDPQSTLFYLLIAVPSQMSFQLFTLRFYAVVFQSLWVWACDIFDYNFGKYSEAQFGFQTVMQSGVSNCCFCHPLLLAPTFVGPVRVPVRHAKRRCQKLYTLFFCRICFSLSQVLSRFASPSSRFRAEAPASRVRVAPGRVDPGADFAVPFALHLAEFSRAPKSPVESRKVRQRKV